jgi:excisionase family DNA binding protein
VWLTESQVAEEVQVSKKTVRRLIKAGKLSAANFGTKDRPLYRINPDDLADVGQVANPADHATPCRRHHRQQLPTSARSYMPRVAA